MWSRIKNFIRNTTPRKVKDFFAYQDGDEFSKKVYSQEGEDILLKRIFDHSPIGFYVDVGAHHPFRFSNTKLLYDKGWCGINIEANPDINSEFAKWRKRDINLSFGIGSKNAILTYYKYNHSALNTFDASLVAVKEEKPITSEEIKVLTLESVLDKNLPNNQTIDLLTIDVEGMDYDILKSNNWIKYKPTWICVELPVLEIDDIANNEIYIFLKNQDYKLFCKLWRSCLFKLS